MFVIWVCTRDSTFFCIQHSTLIYATFKFSLSTFTFHTQQSSFRIRPSSSVGCTFTFSHPTFSIFPLSFCPTLGIVLASFRIRHSTFRIELLPAGQPQMETVGSIDLTHPRSNGGRESVDADSANRNNFVPSQNFTWPAKRQTHFRSSGGREATTGNASGASQAKLCMMLSGKRFSRWPISKTKLLNATALGAHWFQITVTCVKKRIVGRRKINREGEGG